MGLINASSINFQYLVVHYIKKYCCLFQTFNVIIVFDIPSSFLRSNKESWFPSYLFQDIQYFADPHYILLQELCRPDILV